MYWRNTQWKASLCSHLNLMTFPENGFFSKNYTFWERWGDPLIKGSSNPVFTFIRCLKTDILEWCTHSWYVLLNQVKIYSAKSVLLNNTAQNTVILPNFLGCNFFLESHSCSRPSGDSLEAIGQFLGNSVETVHFHTNSTPEN